MQHIGRQSFGALALALTLAAPLAAETVSECQNRVIRECAAALEDSNWAEKIAVGVFCTGRIAGCSAITLKVTPI